MVVGCYSMDLYCDFTDPDRHGYRSDPCVYTGKTGPDCKRQAKKDGWRFFKDDQGTELAKCPKCVKNNRVIRNEHGVWQ